MPDSRKNRTVQGTEYIGKAALFAAVARHGSFSAAAAALGMARSTVSEHVSALEETLGVRLLERTTRRVGVTQEGELLLERLGVALQAWDEAWSALQARRSEPAGTLRVTAPGGIAGSFVAPVCAALMREHPRLDIELIVDDRVRDLTADGVDVAVRMAPLADEAHRSQKIFETRTIVVAAPGLVDDAHTELDDLHRYGWVGHHAITSLVYHLYGRDNRRHEFRPRVRAVGSNSEGQTALVESGCGLALMPAIIVSAAIEQGRVVRVFNRFAGRTIPVYAATQRRSFPPSRVLRFVERLSAAAVATESVQHVPIASD